MKRFFAVLAVVFTLTLSGCSVAPTLTPGSVVNVAEVGALLSLNPDLVTTSDSQHVASEIANLTTLAFYSLDAKGQLVANKRFGTVKVVSTSPFVVEYALKAGIKWSDGQPVDSADLMLSFAAATNAGEAEFNSLRKNSGLQYASVKSMGERSLTLEFSQAVADYQSALTVSVPAHVVANAALDGIESAAGKQALIAAIEGNDKPKLGAIAAAYTRVYASAKGNPDAAAFVSNGAYEITKFVNGTSVTLTANSKFSAGHAPTIETVVLHLFGDSTAAVSAMYSGEVDVITASESGLAKLTDILSLVAALPEGTASTEIRNSDSADVVLLNFGKDSIFSDAKSPNHPERAALLREAVMNLIPKAKIFQLANADYEVTQSDSFIFQSTSTYYSASKLANGSQDHLIQDVEKAAELVNQSGVSTPLELRVIYDKTNPRSKAQFELLAERAASAGFEVVDLAAYGVADTLTMGEYDLFIGPMPLTGVPGNSPSSLLAGFTSYENEKVTTLLSSYALAKTDVAKAEVLRKIDSELFASGYGMPLIEVPNLVIYSSKLKTITPAPYGNSSTWGYWTWSLSTK